MTHQPVAFTMKLEVVPIPSADLNRAKAFYADKVGFHVDHDVSPADGMRIIQLTPPGSGCSIVLGQGIGDFPNMTPGAVKGLHLVVDNVRSARETLIARGVDIGEVVDMGGILYAGFTDPDGNTWLLQEIPPNIK